LQESYGRKKEVCIETVKEIYDELDLPLIYSEYEDRTYAEIKEEIKLLPESIPQKPVLQALDELYRREK
jgi:farnesyl diphosphate synthase